MPLSLHRPDASPTPTYKARKLTLSTGERFSLVVDAETGVPPLLAMRYALRRRRGSADVLHLRMLAVAALYGFFDSDAGGRLGLDAALLAERCPSSATLLAALDRAALDLARARRPDRDPALAGAIRPGGHGAVREAEVSGRTRNRLARYWSDFLRFAVQPLNWQSGVLMHDDQGARLWRQEVQDDLAGFLADALVAEPSVGTGEGFTPAECAVLEDLLGPGEDGRFAGTLYAPETRLRNWVVYLLCRFGGLRKSEVLKLKLEDLPPRVVDPRTGVAGWAHRWVRVTRRPHDLEDANRRRRPHVKRDWRDVWLDDDVLDTIQDYVETDRAARRPRHGYLIVSETDGAPLGPDRLTQIANDARAQAVALFEGRHPGAATTLGRFRWHRLRHTCAAELLPAFRGESNGLQKFLLYFGWKSEASAAPYVRQRWREEAGALVEEHHAALAVAVGERYGREAVA